MENSSVVGWLFALLSYHSWVLFSSLTVTYVLYLNTNQLLHLGKVSKEQVKTTERTKESLLIAEQNLLWEYQSIHYSMK